MVGVKDKPGVAASIFKPLSENFINVDMVVQNISANGKETDLTFTIKSENLYKTENVKLISINKNLIDKIWPNKPKLKFNKFFILKTQYAGKSFKNKINLICKILKRKK